MTRAFSAGFGVVTYGGPIRVMCLFSGIGIRRRSPVGPRRGVPSAATLRAGGIRDTASRPRRLVATLAGGRVRACTTDTFRRRSWRASQRGGHNRAALAMAPYHTAGQKGILKLSFVVFAGVDREHTRQAVIAHAERGGNALMVFRHSAPNRLDKLPCGLR